MRSTKWVATVRGSGMGTLHMEAASRDELDSQLGDLQDAIGRVRWDVDERPMAWHCDGADGCKDQAR